MEISPANSLFFAGALPINMAKTIFSSLQPLPLLIECTFSSL